MDEGGTVARVQAKAGEKTAALLGQRLLGVVRVPQLLQQLGHTYREAMQ